MNKENDNIEKRLQKIKNLYYKLDEMMDSLPEGVPESLKEPLKKAIFGDEDLRELMEGLDKFRAPRFMMVGRTGVGKSSLVNAICGKYLAEVSDVEIGTTGIKSFEYKDAGRTLLEVLDTRGIGESVENAVEGEKDAESVLIDKTIQFAPDAILFLVPCAARDRIDEDIKTLKHIKRKYYKETNIDVPIIVILNQADRIAPTQYLKPEDYTDQKIQNINKSIEQKKKIFAEQQFKVNDIIAVSSYMDWGVSEDEIKDMTETERDSLEIQFDGRYNIDELILVLGDSIDVEARVGLLISAGLNQIVERLSKKFKHIFAGAAGLVAVTPIPLADIYILTLLQGILVMFIAMLSGREMSLKSAKEFILNLSGVGASGLVFRTAAQQFSKLGNLIVPGAGSAISGGIAYAGTEMIGDAAINYYIKGIDIKEIKRIIKKKNQDKK